MAYCSQSEKVKIMLIYDNVDNDSCNRHVVHGQKKNKGGVYEEIRVEELHKMEKIDPGEIRPSTVLERVLYVNNTKQGAFM